MRLSISQILSPWVGAAVAWLAAHGVQLTGGQEAALIALSAAACANLAHLIEARIFARSAGTWPPKPPGPTLPKALLLPLLLCLPLLHGCASVPVQSVDEGLYAAQGTYAAVENALAMAVANGTITPATARALDAQAAKAEALITAAHALEASDPVAAHNDLLQVLVLLQTIQAAIGPPPPVASPGAPPAGKTGPPGGPTGSRASP